MSRISAQYVDGLELRIKELGEQVEKLTGLVVMRFDHDVPSQFSQGYSEHEMGEPVTAAHCKWFVGEIVALREQVEKLKNRLNKDSQEFTILCAKETEKVLREQVENLKAELKSIDGALNDPRANLTLTTSEIIWELKGQLAALAEQNEKLRVALQAMVDEAFARNCGLKIADDALSLPDLASPVLNRIRAEGMRMAADICSEKHSLSAAEEAIRARADELTKGDPSHD